MFREVSFVNTEHNFSANVPEGRDPSSSPFPSSYARIWMLSFFIYIINNNIVGLPLQYTELSSLQSLH